jgi:hypothetical protein
MVAVSPLEIRERVGLSESDASNESVLRFIKAASTTVGLELDKTIDPMDCSEEEAEAIRNIGAVYCVCSLFGGSATILSFRLGDLAVNESSSSSQNGFSRENLQFLMNEAQRIIDNLKKPYFGSV